MLPRAGLKEKDLDRFMNRSRLKNCVVYSTTICLFFLHLLKVVFVIQNDFLQWNICFQTLLPYIYEGWCSEDGSLSFDQHYQACSSCDITGNWEFMQFLIFLWIPIWMMRLDLCVPLLLFHCLPRNSTGLSLNCPLKHSSSPQLFANSESHGTMVGTWGIGRSSTSERLMESPQWSAFILPFSIHWSHRSKSPQ